MARDFAALKARTDILEVVGRYLPLTKCGGEYLTLCPFHDDHDPSFYVQPVKQFCGCWSCNETWDVFAFLEKHLGISIAEAYDLVAGEGAVKLPPRKPVSQRGVPRPERICSKPPFGEELKLEQMALRFGGPDPIKPEVAREFRDEDGELICYEARYPRGCDPKAPDTSPSRMWTWGQVGNDEPTWACRVYTSPDGLRPLYGLHRIGARENGALPQIVICEGPKKADAGDGVLPESNFACISWSGGARAWKKHDWRPLAGRSVVIWPDADDVGISAARSLAGMLSDLKCSVKVIAPMKKNDAAGS